jgi:CRP-like cAMP-binding protein
MIPTIDGEEIANRLMLALPSAALKALQPHITRQDFKRGRVLYRPGDHVETVYFINRGMVSVVKTMLDGRTVEVNTRGIEGLTAPEVLSGFEDAILECLVQVPGTAFAIPTRQLRDIMAVQPALDGLVRRYISLSTEQMAQTAACNRLHSLEQRVCRWFLTALDSARAESFSLTQEFLAMILGTQRPHLTAAIGLLQRANFIRYGRGRVTILDRDGLEATACECYATIEAEIERLFRPAHP